MVAFIALPHIYQRLTGQSTHDHLTVLGLVAFCLLLWTGLAGRRLLRIRQLFEQGWSVGGTVAADVRRYSGLGLGYDIRVSFAVRDAQHSVLAWTPLSRVRNLLLARQSVTVVVDPDRPREAAVVDVFTNV